MDINFNCDRCGQHLTVDDTSVGMSVQCPKCRHNLIIPNPETTRRAEKNCPYCGEKILAVASKCKHCGEILTAKTPNPLPPPPPEPSAKKPVVDPFISSPKERPVAPRILGVVGAIIDIAIAVAAFADGQILAGFSFIGAGVAFLVIAPLAWAIGDAFRKYAQPSFYFAKGAVDLAKKRFFWTYGPQLIGVAAGFGILFWLAFIVADVRDKTKKPASHDGTLVHSAVMSDSRRVSELQEQLKQLDVEKQQKLNAVESDCDLELKNVNKDILDLIQLINVAQQKLADLKSQHDPVAEQLKPLQAQRDTIEAKYERQISDAELQIKNGIAAADKYKTEMLAGTAKLINDAIIANNLSIDLVPKNGIYATTESRGEDDIEPDGWTGGHWGGATHCIGTILEYKVATSALGPTVGTVVGFRDMPYMKQGLGLRVVRKVEPGFNITADFYRFPTALANTQISRTFFAQCISYVNQMAAYKRACDPKLVEALQKEYRLALQKWDYQNGEKFESLKQQVLPLANRIKARNEKLSEFNAQLTEKTALAGKPRSVVIAESRDKITAAFEERKRALMAEITSAQSAVRP